MSQQKINLLTMLIISAILAAGLTILLATTPRSHKYSVGEKVDYLGVPATVVDLNHNAWGITYDVKYKNSFGEIIEAHYIKERELQDVIP